MIERGRKKVGQLLDELIDDERLGGEPVAFGASADEVAQRSAVFALCGGEVERLKDFVDKGAVDRSAAALEPVAIIARHGELEQHRHRSRCGDARALVTTGAQFVTLEFTFGGGVALDTVRRRDGAAGREARVTGDPPLAAQRRAARGPRGGLRRDRRHGARWTPRNRSRNGLDRRPYGRAVAACRQIIEIRAGTRPCGCVVFKFRQCVIVMTVRGRRTEQQPSHRGGVCGLAVLAHRPVPRDIAMLGAGQCDIELAQVLASSLLMGRVDRILSRR